MTPRFAQDDTESRGAVVTVFEFVYQTSPGGASRCLRTCLRWVKSTGTLTLARALE